MRCAQTTPTLRQIDGVVYKIVKVEVNALQDANAEGAKLRLEKMDTVRRANDMIERANEKTNGGSRPQDIEISKLKKQARISAKAILQNQMLDDAERTEVGGFDLVRAITDDHNQVQLIN